MIIGKYVLEETEKTLIYYNFKWNLLKSIKIHGRKMCVEEEKKASFYKFTKIVNNFLKPILFIIIFINRHFEQKSKCLALKLNQYNGACHSHCELDHG